MTKFYIEDYYSGDTILDKKGNYTRYFKTLDDAEDFLNSLGSINDDDNFYIVEQTDGISKPIEY
tara:strand:- start:269 stop:460 length:192 start_codon:yes stop_codon:yes gene_type:complete